MAPIQRLEYEYKGLFIPCHLYRLQLSDNTEEVVEYVYWSVEDGTARKDIRNLVNAPGCPVEWGWDLSRVTDHLLKTGQLVRVTKGYYERAGLSPKPRLLPSPTPCRRLICAKAASGNTRDVGILCQVTEDPSLLHSHMKEHKP